MPDVALVRYDAACRAIAAAKTIDEVRTIRNAAAALRAYAKQAKNKQLELDAVEIRIRAERRAGELIAAQREAGLLSKGGRPSEKPHTKTNAVSRPPTLDEVGIDDKLADRSRKLAALPEQKFEKMVGDWRTRATEQAGRISTDLMNHRRMAPHYSSDTDEHHTPPVILTAAVACLGAIDLDPCSNNGRNVPARRHYTKADDGLAQDWRGRVYMNPPYGRVIDAWVEKLCHEHERQRVTAALALVPARTDTQWWQRLRNYVCCFVVGRLTFGQADEGAPFPSAVFYLGNDIGKFHAHFKDLGDIWQRIEPGMFAE